MFANPPASARDLQRLRCWQGQMLRSRDFRDQLAIEGQFRFWHNRAMHNAFGVVSGLKVTLEGESVKIEPGIAYDGFGHELVLQRPHSSLLPPTNQPMTLLACYKESRSYPSKNEVGEACVVPKGGLFAEEPQFVWKASATLDPSDGVPLAELVVIEDAKKFSLKSDFTNPVVRAMARPKIVVAKTILGATPWEAWAVRGGGDAVFGFQATIDASAWGFTEPPCYFAWLQGPLRNGLDMGGAHWDHIDLVSREGFVFRFVIFFVDLRTEAAARELLQKQFFVSWMGIQPNRTQNHVRQRLGRK
jgi:hypothetical protein